MMNPMFPAQCPARRIAVTALVVAAASAIAGCGDGKPTASAETAATSTTSTISTTSATTTAPTTTTSTTSTTPTSTTTSTTVPPTTTSVPPSTLVAQDTDPIDPPTDEYASEPVIEMGTLAIPKIDVEMTMYEGIRLSTLDYGPGHWPGTALPGQLGNVVVAGHRTSKHRVFRNIDQLVAGDEIVFTDDDGVHTYVVDHVEIVEPTAVWIVEPTPTATATLFACHPPGSTSQRIAVFADLVTD